MTALNIPDLGENLESELRLRAARSGSSLEAEALRILSMATLGRVGTDNVADAIAALTDPVGGVPLDIPPRFSDREPPFGEVLWDDPE